MTNEKGFTLLETLVAMAITAISLAAVGKLAFQLTSDTSAVFEKTLAMLVAENQLTKLHLMARGVNVTAPSLSTENQLNTQWGYRVERTATSDERVQKINIAVFRGSEENTQADIVSYIGKSW